MCCINVNMCIHKEESTEVEVGSNSSAKEERQNFVHDGVQNNKSVARIRTSIFVNLVGECHTLSQQCAQRPAHQCRLCAPPGRWPGAGGAHGA